MDEKTTPLTQTPPVTLTEEELREVLPAHLLDDLEGTVIESGARVANQDHDEPKKKSWFSLGRRRRSLSASSAAEAIFSEFKAGTTGKQSLSDRLPPRPKLTEDDSHDGNATYAGGHSSTQSSPTVLNPPPGF